MLMGQGAAARARGSTGSTAWWQRPAPATAGPRACNASPHQAGQGEECDICRDAGGYYPTGSPRNSRQRASYAVGFQRGGVGGGVVSDAPTGSITPPHIPLGPVVAALDIDSWG